MPLPEHRFTNQPTAPRDARAWIAESLVAVLPPVQPAADDLVQDVLIVVSEPVTNALRCGATAGLLTYRLQDGHLQVTVTDNGDGWPHIRDAGPTDTHGRGLLVVTQLSTTVGVEPVEGGKQV
jgi:anti-sigma regulatory factor (Ser/Thr protein kinase)